MTMTMMTMRDADAIYNLAHSAVRIVERRFNTLDLRDERSDLRQEAATAIVAHLRDAPDAPNGRLVIAAANDVTTFLTRCWNRQPRRVSLHAPRLDGDKEVIEYVKEPTMPTEDQNDVSDDLLRELAQQGRVKGGARAERAIARDTAILRLRAEGYTEKRIAEILGLTKSNVHMALVRIRERQRRNRHAD